MNKKIRKNVNYVLLFAFVFMATPGAYFIGLVHFACIYQKSPYNIVTYSGTGLTQAQANKLQQVAWDTVRNYPYSGAYGM